jgi:transcriptional regulator with XRE-family HTH domain
MTQLLDDKLTREFKTNLQRLLDERNSTNPKQLSLAAGLGETAVRDLLKNRAHSPKLETVHKIANALEIRVYDLIPSLIGQSYEEIESLRAENQALREALSGGFTNKPKKS